MATILIVDDRPTDRELLTTLLGHLGYRLMEADDGAQALAVVQAEHPALVITDVLMPTMDGFEFVQHLRADPTIASTPVIFYTAEYLRPEAHALARSGGVFHLLAKPAEPEQILRVVHKALGLESTAVVGPAMDEFDHDHLRLLTDKLASQVNQLEAAHRRQAVLAELGQSALMGTGPQTLMEDAVALVARTLDSDYAQIVELLPEDDALRPRASVGWEEGPDGQAMVDVGINRQTRYTLLCQEPVIVEDLRAETRFSGSPLQSEQGITSGLSVVIPGNERPFGVLGAHTITRRIFNRDESDFCEAVANVLASAIDRSRAEEALRRSEEWLRLAVTGARLGTWHRDLRTGHVHFSDACLALFGLPASADWTYERFLEAIHAEDRAGVDRALRYAIENHTEYDIEYRVVWRDGMEHWIAAKGCVYYDTDAQPLRMEGVVLDVTPRKRAERELEENAHQLRELTHRLLGVQEAERRHLSRELHDEIGQALTAVKINLQGAIGGGTELAARLEESVSIVDWTLQQVRSMALDLRPSLLDDLGLVPALEWYVRRHAERTGLQGRFIADPHEIRADPEIEIACFRVAQEALTNIARHARASRFSVELLQHAGGLSLVVRDDGVGFNPVVAARASAHGSGLGLIGMRERVELVGGQIAFVCEPGEGTEVQASFPVLPTAAPGTRIRESHL